MSNERTHQNLFYLTVQPTGDQEVSYETLRRIEEMAMAAFDEAHKAVAERMGFRVDELSGTRVVVQQATTPSLGVCVGVGIFHTKETGDLLAAEEEQRRTQFTQASKTVVDRAVDAALDVLFSVTGASKKADESRAQKKRENPLEGSVYADSLAGALAQVMLRNDVKQSITAMQDGSDERRLDMTEARRLAVEEDVSWEFLCWIDRENPKTPVKRRGMS